MHSRGEYTAPRSRLRPAAIAEASCGRIRGIDFKVRLRSALHQRGRLAGAGHRMPLIAHAAGSEYQRIINIGNLGGFLIVSQNEARTAIRCSEMIIGIKPLRTVVICSWAGPLDWSLAQPLITHAADIDRRVRGQRAI